MTRVSEPTDQGDQVLIDGVTPITTRDRLAALAALPMRPKRNPNARQKHCDHGLFDEIARAQMDFFDCVATNEKG